MSSGGHRWRVALGAIGVGLALGAGTACGDSDAGPATGGAGGSGGGGGAGGAAATGGAAGTAGAGGVDDGRCAFQRGWARDTRGGLGGDVIRVTTLAPTGPGSLGEALATSGPRVVVFEVGGVVDLDTASLAVHEPYVTIAGQTAPSPGISLIRGTLVIATHDVVVQHLRVRPGQAGQSTGWEPDGISIVSGRDVVVDHCSTSWAVDENLSASGPQFEGATPDEWRENTSHRVTLSRNIVAEALSNATHSKGEHSKGTLIHDNAMGILVYGNLYASNVDRNPLLKGGVEAAVVNNYVANPASQAVSYVLVESEWGAHPYLTGQLSLVGNVFHHGLDTAAAAPLFRVSGVGPVEVYRADNVAVDVAGEPVDWLGGYENLALEVATPPAWPEGLTARPSATLLTELRDDVGARPWDRDEIDARIVEQAWAGTGRHIDHETEGGGYPDDSPTSAAFVGAEWDECFDRVE